MGWLSRRRRKRHNHRALVVLWACAALGQATAFELCKVIGVPVGSLYPTLASLEGSGCIWSERETPEPRPDDRPRLRHYMLTNLGRERAKELVAVMAGRDIPSRYEYRDDLNKHLRTHGEMTREQ